MFISRYIHWGNLCFVLCYFKASSSIQTEAKQGSAWSRKATTPSWSLTLPCFKRFSACWRYGCPYANSPDNKKNSPQWPNRQCEVIGARTKRSLRCSFGYTGGGVDEAVDAVTLLMCFRLAHPLLLSLYHQRGLWSYLAHQNYTSFVREGNLNQRKIRGTL